MAPAHPHATLVAVYPALFSEISDFTRPFSDETRELNVGYSFHIAPTDGNAGYESEEEIVELIPRPCNRPQDSISTSVVEELTPQQNVQEEEVEEVDQRLHETIQPVSKQL